jgi:hypothetical protein
MKPTPQILLLPIAITCALALFPTRAHPLSLPVTEDACIQSKKISAVTASISSLSVDSASTPVLFFSLDHLPEGSAARLAYLRLFVSSVRAKGDGLRLHRVLGPWEEAKPGDAPTIDPNPIASVSSSEIASKRFVTFNVTETLNQWLDGSLPNEGFAVLAGPGTRLSTPSKEGILNGLPATLDIELLGGDPSTGEGAGPGLSLTSPVATKIIGDTLQNLMTPKLSAPLALSSQGPIPFIGLTATGFGDLTYTWKRDGIPQTSLVQPQIRRAGLAGGTYQVTVSNNFTSVQSGTLSIPDNGHEWIAIPGQTFSLSKYETSLSQWKAFVSETGYKASQQWANTVSFADGSPFTQTDFEPVVCVSKADAELYCSWLSQKTGRTCRLPSDREWTAAAGSTLYPWGNTFPPTQDSGNFSPGFHGGNDPAIDGFRFTSPVGSFKPSPLGLYDLGGNVWEWTSDGNIRGASWENFDEDLMQSAAVVEHDPSERHPCIGFRVAVGALTPTGDWKTPLSYYPFDGDTLDKGLLKNNLINTGATPAPDRFNRPNRAYQFNGTSNWMISEANLPIKGSQPRAFSVWLKIPNRQVTPNPVIVEHGRKDGTATLFSFIYTGNDGHNTGDLHIHGSWVMRGSRAILPINQWFHTVVSTNGSVEGTKFYVDGKPVEGFGGASGPFSTELTKLRLSTYSDQGGISNSSSIWWETGFPGSMDELRVYNFDLSDSDVAEIYKLESQP